MRVRIKICGLTTPEMVRVAVEAGADAVGLVFATSPRQVDPVRAAELLAAVPAGIERVAVFRTPSSADLEAIAHLALDLVQADAGWTGGLPPGWGRLPALADGPDLLDRVEAWLRARPESECDPDLEPATPGLRGAILLDGPIGGGSGVRADPRRAAAVARRLPLVLAGGLDPDNVGEALTAVQPFGVDVSSGVEASRGVKDPARIRAFVEAVRKEER